TTPIAGCMTPQPVSRGAAHVGPLKLGNDAALHGFVAPLVAGTRAIKGPVRPRRTHAIQTKEFPVVVFVGSRSPLNLKRSHQQVALAAVAIGMGLHEAFTRRIEQPNS